MENRLIQLFETKPHYLEVMDRISYLSLQAGSVDEMLESILDSMLDIFDCDRAYFMYPVDPQSPTWSVPMERTKPEWPGAYETGVDYPISDEVKGFFDYMLSLDGPFCAGEGHEIPLPEVSVKVFKMRTAMGIVVTPRIGKPWQFGIQHCTNAVVYSDDEKTLFEAISYRVADALTTLITLQDVRKSEAHQRAMFENSPNAIIVFNLNNYQIVDLNMVAVKLFGYSKEVLIEKGYELLFIGDGEASFDRSAHFLNYLNQLDRGEELPVFESELFGVNGQCITCEVRLANLPSAEGKQIYASLVDVTQRLQSEAQQRLMSNAIEQTADTVVITDEKGNIEFVNGAFEKTSGYSRNDVLGRTPSLLKSGKHEDTFYKKIWDTIQTGNTFVDIVVNRRRDGSLYSEEKTISPMYNDEKVLTHYVATGKDISTRLADQERLYFLAHHDVLTELPNRVLFFDRLEQSINRAQRQRSMLAVLFIDLDHFKQVNDSLGHDLGDKVLKLSASRLRDSVRLGDTVARLSGDEFAVIIENLTSSEIVPKVANTIINSFSAPFQVQGSRFYITPSIGISFYPNDGEQASVLIKHADIAMYQAKQQGRNTYQFYAKEMRELAEEKNRLERNLRDALERGELYLLYQPQLYLPNGELPVVEALLRWEHPELGLVMPLDFVPVLEESGQIEKVGVWIIDTVCQQIKLWADHGLPPIRVAVNISARQFERGNLVDIVLSALNKYGVQSRFLELEVTESVLMRNEEKAIEMLSELKGLGVRVTLDDFGTGYSSLIYLKRFPIGTIKIDRSFVMGLGENHEDEAIVKGVTSLAKSLGLSVVAEGVETDVQFEYLKDLGCDYIQGYVVSRPIPADAVEVLLLKK